MNQIQTDAHLKKNYSSQCRIHPAQTQKYYCSDLNCRISLCFICFKTHPKEHLPNLTTIKQIKTQTLDILKKETLNRFDTILNSLLNSNKTNDLFKEAFGNLMQQNTTVDINVEDVADILADTLQRKYFEKGVVISEKIKEKNSVKFSSTDLIGFDYKFDAGDDEKHGKNMKKFCQSSSEYYCQEQLGSFYAKSKGQVIFWNRRDQTLLCKDIVNPENESKKYQIPFPFEFLTVLESEGELFFIVTFKNQFIVYSIQEELSDNISEENSADPCDSQEEKNLSCLYADSDEQEDFPETYSSLKMRSEFAFDARIVFLASDHVRDIFVVTEEEGALTATFYTFSSQNNKLEFDHSSSFRLFILPKKAMFDKVNNLVFLLGKGLLGVYKYHMMPKYYLQIICKVKANDFIWHQATKRLLLTDPKKTLSA